MAYVPLANFTHVKIWPDLDPDVERIVREYLHGKTSPAEDFYYVEISAAPGAGKTAIIAQLRREFHLEDHETVEIVLDDIVKKLPGYNEEIAASLKRWKDPRNHITDEEQITISKDIYEKYQDRAELIERTLMNWAASRKLNVVFERNLWITSSRAFQSHAKDFWSEGARTFKVAAVASPERLKNRILERGRQIGRLPDYRAVELMNDFTQSETVDHMLEFEEVRIFDLDIDFTSAPGTFQTPQQLASIKGFPNRVHSYQVEAANTYRINELSLSGVLVSALRTLLAGPAKAMLAQPLLYSSCVVCQCLTKNHCPCSAKVRYCNGFCQTVDLDRHKQVCSRM
jgi:hypothetical protein